MSCYRLAKGNWLQSVSLYFLPKLNSYQQTIIKHRHMVRRYCTFDNGVWPIYSE